MYALLRCWWYVSQLGEGGACDLSAVWGVKVQEANQIGRNVEVMTLRKRTKKYVSRPLAGIMAWWSVWNRASGHVNIECDRGFIHFLRNEWI